MVVTTIDRLHAFTIEMTNGYTKFMQRHAVLFEILSNFNGIEKSATISCNKGDCHHAVFRNAKSAYTFNKKYVCFLNKFCQAKCQVCLYIQ